MLGSPVAYELPALPGLGYLKVDTEMSRFKAALVSLPHRPPTPETEQVAVASVLRQFALAADRSEHPSATASDPGAGRESELDVVVRRMVEAGPTADRIRCGCLRCPRRSPSAGSPNATPTPKGPRIGWPRRSGCSTCPHDSSRGRWSSTSPARVATSPSPARPAWARAPCCALS
ncbi:MAG: hypothetical protein ACRDN9_02050 [Streptosporangiaceae bacterium]